MNPMPLLFVSLVLLAKVVFKGIAAGARCVFERKEDET